MNMNACWWLCPTGAVLYRVPLTWGQNKLPWKLLHAALMLAALILSIVGLCAVFDYHNKNNISNVYSLHSWIGITATALFAMQVCMLNVETPSGRCCHTLPVYPSSGRSAQLASSCPVPPHHYVKRWNPPTCGWEAASCCSASPPASQASTRSSSLLCECQSLFYFLGIYSF